VFREGDQPAGYVPNITCTGPIGASDPVAIVVTEEGSKTEVIMRDYAEVTNPRTVCSFPDDFARLLDARHVTFGACSPGGGACALAIVDVPEVRYHWYELPKTPDRFVKLVAVAPDLTAAAWTEFDSNTFARSLHVRDATGEYLIADLDSLEPGDCGPEPVTEAAFARSGSLLYVIDEYVGSHLYVLDGHDVEESLETVYSAVWSPTSDTLYFRKAHHIYRWSPDTEATLIQRDLDWRHPTVSPDGRSLAYAASNNEGGDDIYLADPAHLDQARPIARNASLPVFLNDARLWFKNESPFGCGEGVPPRQSVYNLTASTTATTVITEVLSVWPATTSGNWIFAVVGE
jgi:hypothetical protein